MYTERRILPIALTCLALVSGCGLGVAQASVHDRKPSMTENGSVDVVELRRGFTRWDRETGTTGWQRERTRDLTRVSEVGR